MAMVACPGSETPLVWRFWITYEWRRGLARGWMGGRKALEMIVKCTKAPVLDTSVAGSPLNTDWPFHGRRERGDSSGIID